MQAGFEGDKFSEKTGKFKKNTKNFKFIKAPCILMPNRVVRAFYT